jgi:hypothetical protein
MLIMDPRPQRPWRDRWSAKTMPPLWQYFRVCRTGALAPMAVPKERGSWTPAVLPANQHFLEDHDGAMMLIMAPADDVALNGGEGHAPVVAVLLVCAHSRRQTSPSLPQRALLMDPCRFAWQMSAFKVPRWGPPSRS